MSFTKSVLHPLENLPLHSLQLIENRRVQYLDDEHLALQGNGAGIVGHEVIDQVVPGIEDLVLVETTFEPESLHRLFHRRPHVLLELGNILRLPIASQLREGALSHRALGTGTVGHGARVDPIDGPLHKKTTAPRGDVVFTFKKKSGD